MYTVKKYKIDTIKLINKLKKIVTLYKKKGKCLYVNWLASDLGLPKTTFTAFLIENSHIFKTKVGHKSNRLILEDINKDSITIGDLYYSEENEFFAVPLCYDSINDLFVCYIEYKNGDTRSLSLYEGLDCSYISCLNNVSEQEEKKDEFERLSEFKKERRAENGRPETGENKGGNNDD